MGIKALETASYAAGFAMASCEDPDYYSGSANFGMRPMPDAATPLIPAAYVAANSDRHPYPIDTYTRNVGHAVRSVSQADWQRLFSSWNWNRRLAT